MQQKATGIVKNILSSLTHVAKIKATDTENTLIFFSLNECSNSAIKKSVNAIESVSVCIYLGHAINKGDKDKIIPKNIRKFLSSVCFLKADSR